jgi:hypothetical protein
MQDDELRKLVRKRKTDEATEKREILKGQLRKKLQTSFIGAIAKFEETFGHLWRHGEHYDALTDREADFRDAWEECRHSVLNNGNNQIRGMESEVDGYYRYNFERESK